MGMTRDQFDAAVRSHGPSLFALLTRMTHGRVEDAEELVQQTFLTAWRVRDRFEGGDVEPYLNGIARKVFLAYLRSKYRRWNLGEAVDHHVRAGLITGTPSDPIEVLALRECLDQLEETDARIVNRLRSRVRAW